MSGNRLQNIALIAAGAMLAAIWLQAASPRFVHAVRTPNAVTDAQLKSPAQRPSAYFRRVLARYCVSCHNEKTLTADLSLETIDVTRIAENAATWEKVVRKLRTRAMPPPESPRPDEAAYDSFAAYLAFELDREAQADPDPGRRPAVHRLNRVEYANAIRDLLALDYDSAQLLPPDDTGYGFDNIADVLSVSPMLTERYLSAARKVSRLAVGDPTIRPVTETFTVDKYLRQEGRVSEDLPFGSRGGLAVRHYFPLDGDYVVKIYLSRTYDGRVRGLAEPNEIELRLDGTLIEKFTIGRRDDAPAPARRRRDLRNSEDDGREIRFSAKAGPRMLGVSFIGKGPAPEGMLRPRYAVTSYDYAGDQTIPPAIARIELSGPYDVKGRGDTPSRRRIFVCRPASEEDEEVCATRILTRLARRAYRRPPTQSDLRTLLDFFAAGRAKRDFDAGIEMALRRILVSPDFLFRTERDPADIEPGTAYRINDLELASRLSFFLWSSIPDDELLDLAEQGRLHDPATLEHQVRRMLADVRSKALVTNFCGQWLHLRNIRLVSPDPRAFPEFDANLRLALEREMQLFLESQLHEDRSVVELLTADYTFVNERLARHYGIRNVYGNHFRRVTLTQESRRGLLGKASLLTVTSYPHRTSPVLRGKWLLENILGSPPPAPPPDVPELTENDAGADRPLSVRQRMEAHRADPVCASCHQIMDPLGFALENFDGIGRWRTVDEAGSPIDATGRLTDGSVIDGPSALSQALLDRREQFVTTVIEKLLTYALGRGVEYYDAPAVRRIRREAAKDDDRWSSLIVGVTKSAPFLMRRSSGP